MLSIICEMYLIPKLFIMLGALAKDIAVTIMDVDNASANQNADQTSIGETTQMMKKVIEIVQFQTMAKKFASNVYSKFFGISVDSILFSVQICVKAFGHLSHFSNALFWTVDNRLLRLFVGHELGECIMCF